MPESPSPVSQRNLILAAVVGGVLMLCVCAGGGVGVVAFWLGTRAQPPIVGFQVDPKAVELATAINEAKIASMEAAQRAHLKNPAASIQAEREIDAALRQAMDTRDIPTVRAAKKQFEQMHR